MTPSYAERLRHRFMRLLFTVTARFYAWMTWQPTWREHCASLADHFPSPEHRLAVLDLGIGPGISGIGILDRRPSAFVVGLDFARSMLVQARRYLLRAQCRLDLVHGDVMNLPFADESFDVVTHHSFLYLLSNQKRALIEILRVLRPGGAYVILEPNREGRLLDLLRGDGGFRFKLSMTLWRIASRSFGRFTPQSLTALLVEHGFVEVEIDPTLCGLGLLLRAKRQARAG